MRWIVFLVGLLIVIPAAAQPKLLQAHASGSPPTYTGLIDVVGSPSALYSFRAGSAAIAAAGTQTLTNLRRASDNVACDFLPTTAGGFGLTTSTCNSSTQGGVSYGTFVGSDGTASCTLAGTTGACTGASGTVHINDVVTGVGLTQPCVVTTASNIAPVISIAGTTTSCGTISVAETFTFQVAGFVTEMYDQSGNSRPVLQSTAGNQFQFLPSCISALPCMTLNSTAQGMTTSGNFTPASGAVSFSFVVNQIAGTVRTVWLSENGTVVNRVQHTNGSANTWSMFGGSSGTFNATANDVKWHSANTVMNAASSVMNIDGVETTGTATGNTTAGLLSFGTPTAGTGAAYFSEIALYDNVTFSAGNRTGLCQNQQGFYGAGNFGAAC